MENLNWGDRQSIGGQDAKNAGQKAAGSPFPIDVGAQHAEHDQRL